MGRGVGMEAVMTDTKMVDVTLHIDEAIGADKREALRDDILGRNGVMGAVMQPKTPHLLVVEYDPERITSTQLLETVTAKGLHAELVGL